jgi:predicted AlkP superfamily phosphohydrolase/phosphomutase
MIRRISDTQGPRLIIIGLDGASFNYLDPILKTGKLPNFARLFKNGVRSNCLSTIPPLTPPAWSTMLTGVNPGKHGIFDFLQPDESGAFRVVDARFRRRKSFLDHAKSNDIRIVSLLVPYTFPPDPEANGLIVSGLGTPSAESDFIRPHGYRDVLLDEFPFLREVDPTKGESLETLHANLHRLTASTINLARKSMTDIPDWGIHFTVFQATDLIPHFYAKYFDPDHPDYDADDVDVPRDFRLALEKIYRLIDLWLGECMGIIERDGGWVMLVSDHGSQPLMGAIGKDAFLARWLEEHGYLEVSGAAGRAKKAAIAGAGSLANRLLFLAKRYTPHGIRDAVNRALGRRKAEMVDKLTAIPFMEDIIWEKTRVFCAPGGYGIGLYINREGDFPHGIVQKGAEYHRLRDEVKAGLESLEIADGIPLFNGVLTREEALWGPATSLAPDLILLWREDKRLRENDYRLTDGSRLDPPERKSESRLTWCGTHRMEGLFGIVGDGVRHGAVPVSIPNLADICPTIQLLSGVPIPSDLDGSIIREAFEDGYIDTHPPMTGPPEEATGHIDVPPQDESGKMIELLEGLGYLH